MINGFKRKNVTRYLIYTYLLFWVMLGLTGYLISLDVPGYVQTIMKNLCAWAPTLALLLMFRKLYPYTSPGDYFKNNFRIKIKYKFFIIAFLLQALVLIVTVSAYLALNNLSMESISFLSASALVPTFITTVTSGAMGEELGWRGYTQNEFQKKYSPFKSALYVGLIWGFWHFPLWILSGYSGMDLIYYCIFFLLAIISLSVIIAYFYNKGRNILIAMWIHFLFNFFIHLVIIDLLQLIIYLSIAYLLLAFIIVFMNKNEFRSPRAENTKI